MTIGMIVNCECKLNFLFSNILEFPARDKHFQIPEHFWVVPGTIRVGFRNISILSFQNISSGFSRTFRFVLPQHFE